jgi:cytochrome P450
MGDISGPGRREATRLLYTVAPRRPLDFYVDLNTRYGDTVRVPFMNRHIYLLARPEHAEHILATGQDNYVKPQSFRAIRAFIGGDNLLTSDGPYWRRHRRLVQPVFSRRNVTGFAPQMTDAARRVLDRWDTLDQGTVVNASAEIHALTLDVIGRVLFSADLSKEAADLGTALEKGNRAMVLAILLPVPWGPVSTRAVFTATRGFGGVIKGIHGPVRRLLAQRAAEPAPESPRDLLDLLIMARGEDGSGLSPEEISAEVTTLMLGGHETTANALCWTLALLSAYPAARETMEAELADVLGDRDPVADDLDRLPWTQAVISEAMRIYPPAWTLERRALADDEVAGVRIPAGSTVSVPPYLVHRHPEFWPNADGFDPRRFLPGQEYPRYSYIPFGGGRRACVGASLAQLEATMLLAMIARRYRLDLTAHRFPVPDTGLTLRPGRELPMRLVRRA